MKVVLGLAFLCCFIGGIVVAGCGCDRLKDCFCKNDYVIKARVKSDGKPVGQAMVYRIKQLKYFKEKCNFKFVRVPNCFNRTLRPGTVYLFMGKKKNGILKVPKSNGFIKKWETLSDDQIDYLKDEDEQEENCNE